MVRQEGIDVRHGDLTACWGDSMVRQGDLTARQLRTRSAAVPRTRAIAFGLSCQTASAVAVTARRDPPPTDVA